MLGIRRTDITVPNILTLLRIVIALLAGYLLLRSRRHGPVAAWLLLAAALLDFFDGWYARRFSRTTKLGAHLDPFADKVLIAVMFGVLCREIARAWFTLLFVVIITREILITVYRAILRRRSGALIPASFPGKAKTAIQCVVGCSLMLYIYVYPGRVPSGAAPILLAMMLVTFVTVDSGLRYLLPPCRDGKRRSLTERLLQQIFGAGVREV